MLTVQLPTLDGVAAGAKATLSCPILRTYHEITLEFSGVTLAQLQNLELMVNGKVIQSYADGTRLNQINTYHGRVDNTANGFLTLYFDRPELIDAFRKQFAMGTQDVQSVALRFDIDAAAAAPVITAHARISAPSQIGTICKVKVYPKAFSTGGTQEIDNLPRGPRVACVHFFKADVNDVEVEVDAVKVFDASKSLAEDIQLREGKVPQTAAATHLDFIVNGDTRDALATMNSTDLRYRLDLGTSGTVDTVVEYFDQFAGI